MAGQIVRQRMAAQVAVAPEHLAAGQTVIRLDVGVREQVRFQIGALVEAAIAHGALVRRLLHVQNLMDGQRTRLAETLAALEALERFLLGVNVSAKCCVVAW